jgi:flavin-dependent dehydrogenase
VSACIQSLRVTIYFDILPCIANAFQYLDETGWAWFIPLHDDTVSIGIVQDQDSAAAKKRATRSRTGDSTLTAHYLHELKLSPGVIEYMGNNAKLVEIGKDGGSGVKQAADFSYSAGSYAGPGYRLVGDASGAFFSALGWY